MLTNTEKTQHHYNCIRFAILIIMFSMYLKLVESNANQVAADAEQIRNVVADNAMDVNACKTYSVIDCRKLN